jgi:hypothetical protein
MQKRKVVFAKGNEDLIIPASLVPGELRDPSDMHTYGGKYRGPTAPLSYQTSWGAPPVPIVIAPRREPARSGYIPIPPPTLSQPPRPALHPHISNSNLFLSTVPSASLTGPGDQQNSNANVFLTAMGAARPPASSPLPAQTSNPSPPQQTIALPPEKPTPAGTEIKVEAVPKERPKRTKPRSALGIQLPTKSVAVVPQAPGQAKPIVPDGDNSSSSQETSKAESPPIDPATVVVLPQISDLDKLTDAEFQALLAAQNQKSKSQMLRECFQNIATSYMKDVQLQIGSVMCTIVEVEFFYYPDPYVGLDSFFPMGFDEQLLSNHHLYLHHEYNRQTGQIIISKGEKRGLYVTIGSAQSPGAMLIRSIRRLDVQKETPPKPIHAALVELCDRSNNSDIVEGPQHVLDFIVQGLELTIDDLSSYFMQIAAQKGLQSRTLPLDVVCGDPTAKIRFVSSPNPNQDFKMYSGPRLRLNLGLPVTDPYSLVVQIGQPFRYVAAPGDLQTGKAMIALQAQLDSVPDDTIKADLKISGESLGRWRGLFLKGQTMGLERLLSNENSNHDDLKTQIYRFGFFSQFIESLQ